VDPAGKTAVVTGGNSGLGEASVRALLAAGARVYSLDLGGEAPAGAEWLACDVADAQSLGAAVRAIDGDIHILVNCAGIGSMGPIATADGPGDLETIRRVIDVNLVGAINAAAHVAHRMIGNAPDGPDQERGVIVNACSIASFEGQQGMTAYTAAKAGLAGLTLVWTRDLSRHHIRVMGVAPGFMATPMVSFLPQDLVDELLLDAEFPKRPGRAEEFASMAMFIIGNALLNGDVIRLDAGTRPPARTKWSQG
jgi:NAD(P)-dependent dehydrogenase (short-subunit alcohol dehydrogenase family)